MKRFAALIALAMMLASPSPMAAELKPFVRGSWQDVLKANAGKPAVIHFWGLTCAPCLVELPHWAALKRERPQMNMVMIAADPASADNDDLAATLKKAGLSGVENWAFADAFSERLRHEIDPKWRGEMPRTILVDRDGKTTAMLGVADLKTIRDWYDVQSAAKK
jgi:thiol-disulfide isomerase/thioredoxin